LKLGYTDLVHSSVIVGDAVILSLSESDNKLMLTGPGNATRGDHVVFQLNSVASGHRLVRCHVFAPDGSMLPEYARNVLIDATSATFVLPSALNDQPGAYTIRATDIVSGAIAETKIDLK